jgi:phosphopantothenoylcysteine decarboxylase / phosphopantothenate---cysteine ligase
MHPANHLRGSKSDKLAGRKIVLGVTGSIAAVECVKLCRELIRNGADVHAVMSRDAQGIIHPWALEFATGNPVTTEIDGRVQHVSFCGEVPDKADLLLIAPATANTISKMAFGIDDTPVTTFATTAIGGGMPVLVVPAMHGSMMAHKIVLENIEKLKSIGVRFLMPKLEESKAKMPPIDYIVSSVIALVGKRDLVGKKVLVIAGATEEPIDDIRVVTNRSTGETGVELARAAYERGADVELWMGRCETEIPGYISTTRFSTFSSLWDLSKKIKHDIILFPAAVSDFTPKKVDGKISSRRASITITLDGNPKMIDKMRRGFVVGFKAQVNVKDEDLIKEAMALIKRSGCSLVVANSVENVKKGHTKVVMVTPDGTTEELVGTKFEVADRILDRVARMVG